MQRQLVGWHGEGFSRWLLARRSLRDPGAIASYVAYARTTATLPELAATAGLRWTIEECLRAKDDVGLDHCEARSWHGWHRHMSLVMAAAAFLTHLSADQRRTAFRKPNKTSPQNHPAAA
jgi:SRSO17 transposase